MRGNIVYGFLIIGHGQVMILSQHKEIMTIQSRLSLSVNISMAFQVNPFDFVEVLIGNHIISGYVSGLWNLIYFRISDQKYIISLSSDHGSFGIQGLKVQFF